MPTATFGLRFTIYSPANPDLFSRLPSRHVFLLFRSVRRVPEKLHLLRRKLLQPKESAFRGCVAVPHQPAAHHRARPPLAAPAVNIGHSPELQQLIHLVQNLDHIAFARHFLVRNRKPVHGRIQLPGSSIPVVVDISPKGYATHAGLILHHQVDKVRHAARAKPLENFPVLPVLGVGGKGTRHQLPRQDPVGLLGCFRCRHPSLLAPSSTPTPANVLPPPSK